MKVVDWLNAKDRLEAKRPRMRITDDEGMVTGDVMLSDTGEIRITLDFDEVQIDLSLSEFACIGRFFTSFVGEGPFQAQNPIPNCKEREPAKTESEKLAKAPETLTRYAPLSHGGIYGAPTKLAPCADGPAEESTATRKENFASETAAATTKALQTPKGSEVATPETVVGSPFEERLSVLKDSVGDTSEQEVANYPQKTAFKPFTLPANKEHS